MRTNSRYAQDAMCFDDYEKDVWKTDSEIEEEQYQDWLKELEQAIIHVRPCLEMSIGGDMENVMIELKENESMRSMIDEWLIGDDHPVLTNREWAKINKVYNQKN